MVWRLARMSFSAVCGPLVSLRARKNKSQCDQIPLYGSHKCFMRVPDIDTIEFVRLAEVGPNNRRRTSIAAPSQMYQRVAKLRHQMLRQQAVLRRRSFSVVARVDKASSKEDNRLAETFSKVRSFFSIECCTQVVSRTNLNLRTQRSKPMVCGCP